MVNFSFYPERYYWVSYNLKNWEFMYINGVSIHEVYYTESGFIEVGLYREDFYDTFYTNRPDGLDRTRADFCFKVKEDSIFENKEDAIKFAKKQARQIYLNRQEKLLKEYEKLLDKIEQMEK